jgi:hypothetical protein
MMTIREAMPDLDTLDLGFEPKEAELRVRCDRDLNAVVLEIKAAEIEIVLSMSAAIDVVLRMVGALDRLATGGGDA